ncbi:MAG: hypothetical protein H7125_02430, partial [Proteobacteria bacterium]|nr:hypothetical protein [Burkholderiales bacterium]
MIATARQSFAEHGFTVSDEAIAAAAHMPLERLQRLAPDRAALIEAVIAPLFAERWHPEWSAI